MADKEQLSEQRTGQVINTTSKRQEKALLLAVGQVMVRLREKHPGIRMKLEMRWNLTRVLEQLVEEFPGVEFSGVNKTSFMTADGGIVSLMAKNGKLYPILITEKKNQGTNDQRVTEGKARQAQGNAIERLGKNVIGYRATFLSESIFPFVCFGDGCDFAPGSSILDRVVTIAMFGQLNKEYLYNSGPQDVFNRGTFYFREPEWTMEEMLEKSFSIADKSVDYYFLKYTRSVFL